MLRSICCLAFGLVEKCGQVHSFNRTKEWPAVGLLAFGVTSVLPSLNAFLRTWLCSQVKSTSLGLDIYDDCCSKLCEPAYEL